MAAKATKRSRKSTASRGARSGASSKDESGDTSQVPLRLEYIDPAELQANDFNWREHPAKQTQALADVIGEVGWAGALLYNEQTRRLIDGHARKELFSGKGPVPVLIGNWSEADEKKILASLDPIAAMATANAGQLDALLREIATGSEALAEMFEEMANESGLYKVDGAETPMLPDGDKSPFMQITFILHESQSKIVEDAIVAAKSAGSFDGPNENSNGNALARIAKVYLGRC